MAEEEQQPTAEALKQRRKREISSEGRCIGRREIHG